MFTWIFNNLIPRRFKKEVKYIGLDLLYLEDKIEILKEELKTYDPANPYQTFKMGELVAHKEIYESLISR